MADEPIILIKKKGAHGSHHGGAWKVAYADFVTAMMALFIVLWLMNSSKTTQEDIGAYFRDPHGVSEKKGIGLGGKEEITAPKDDMVKLKNELVQSLKKMPEFERISKQVEFSLTPEGLRIEMIEDANGTFFENGKAQPTDSLEDLLKMLSVDIGRLPNPVSIEGHTDSKPYAGSGGYSNWELSADRANMARRLMEASGLHEGQVVQVRGFADRRLRKADEPEDASNRRVSVIVQYREDGQAHVVFGGKQDESHSNTFGAPAH